jgi:ribosomal protein S18 acetylase RimI-like enzyme
MSVIRTVEPNEVSKMMACFTSAFIADPTIRFLYPKATEYLSSSPRLQELHCGDSIASGTVFTIDEFRGVAAFMGPDSSVDEESLVTHVMSTATEETAEEVLALLEAASVCCPDGPHWSLPGIAVDPYYQGNGYGGQLMEFALKKIDQDHLPVYLESSNPMNISLYQRFGFNICESYQLDGRSIYTPMLRPAQ